MPWLYKEVDLEGDRNDLGSQLVDDLLRYCIEQAKPREKPREPEPDEAQVAASEPAPAPAAELGYGDEETEQPPEENPAPTEEAT